MDLEIIIKMCKPELLIIVPVCWGFGLLLKSIKEIPNKFIPSILLLISILLTFLYTNGKNEICNISLKLFFIITQSATLWAISWISYERYIKQGLSISIFNTNNTELPKDDEEKKDIP